MNKNANQDKSAVAAASNASNASPPERVAVVAVHGVGKHEPGASAQAMAELLLGLNAFTDPVTGSSYSGFDATKIEVPLPGPKLFEEKQPLHGSWWRTMFEERRGFFADKSRREKWGSDHKSADLNDEFMVTQLGEYEGDELVGKYESIRLEGKREASPGRQAADVHIYEMYWADLAKRDNSILRFFMSFYQLLIHLCSLGRTAIDHVALEHTGSLPWLFLQKPYNYATRVLTLGMFNFLVLLPVVVFAPITRVLKNGAADATATALLTLLTVGIIALLIHGARGRFPRSKKWLYFLFFALMICLTAAGAAYGAHEFFLTVIGASIYALDLAWWVGAFAIIYFFIFKNYDLVRAGARESGLFSMAAVAAGFVACLGYAGHFKEQSGQVYYAAAFLMTQYVFLLLRLFWMALVALAVLAWVMEFICIRDTTNAGEKARARAAFRTGRLALAVPTVLLLLLTMFAWTGAFYYVYSNSKYSVPLYRTNVLPEAPLPGFLKSTSIQFNDLPRFLSPSAPTGCDSFQTGEANCRELAALLLQSAPFGLPLVLVLMGAGFLLLTLLALPSGVQEFKHPRQATNGQSRSLGEWLSGALSALPVTIYCFWLAAFGLPALYILFASLRYWIRHPDESYMLYLYTWNPWFHSIAESLAFSGPIVAATAVFLVTAGKAIFKSASTILDTILDVDNYLRTSPAKNTPRAPIVERYVALLHFLHEHEPRYNRIVIVAHSLGSLISADALRFLKNKRIPSLSTYAFAGGDAGSIPIRLFTMGSPLRQHMNRFFPNLYEYIRPVPDDCDPAPATAVSVPAATVPPAPSAGTIPEDALPKPSDFGLDVWVNCYRSGDYVGRSLWLDDWMKRTNDNNDQAGAFPTDPNAYVFADAAQKRQEACIGLGAHTHYWDRSAPDVGALLNDLI